MAILKRRGLSFAAAGVVVLLGGIFRVAGPATAPSPPSPAAQASKKAGTSDKAKIGAYPNDLLRTIREFFGSSIKDPAHVNGLAEYWDLPKGRDHVRFVVAVLPDPVHTHLALLFDRSVEALQQAAQRKGFAFDRAILPWDRTPRIQATELDKRQKEIEEQIDRESYPGLLIFREGQARRKAREQASPGKESQKTEEPLFVFIVGETPTGGVRKQQFRKAAEIIGKVRGKPSGSEKPLLVLGPTFSGSLESLKQELERDLGDRTSTEGYVYSGTVTDRTSMNQFEEPADHPGLRLHFASFQENDDYVRDQFIQFACSTDYPPNQIAILSEGETTFGAQDSSRTPRTDTLNACEGDYSGKGSNDVVKLHFPREISYFRSAYQKEVAAPAQQKPDAKLPGASTLHLDLDETGNDDDSVSPYSGAQTPLSQEAVMLGIFAELQKHHIKFTILYATDPADQLFLARYLRTGYPQGRVVITAPDLLFAREEDTLLRGVLAISAYPLVPGLSDKLCQPAGEPQDHEDHLFVSSLSVGTFNAMVGLLSVDEPSNKDDHSNKEHWTPAYPGYGSSQESIPPGPYDEYTTPFLGVPSKLQPCQGRPLLWLTILGRDGFWPIAGIANEDLTALDRQEPIVYLPLTGEHRPTLKSVGRFPSGAGAEEEDDKKAVHRPGSWKIAYYLCFLLLAIHTLLSWTGSILADSEARTQFARTPEWRDAAIVMLGALALATAFVLIMFTSTPSPIWEKSKFLFLPPLMWLPFFLFVLATLWDLGKLRGKPYVALAFAICLILSVGWQIVAWYPLPVDSIGEYGASHAPRLTSQWLPWLLTKLRDEKISVYWSVRLLHFASGLSPVLPVLLLLGAGYWWMWQSLRGVTLVDLRSPRLPRKEDLASFSYRLSEVEANELRLAAHPFVFTRQVWIAILVLLVPAWLTVLDRGHPVQTIEGKAYDWGYASLLVVMIAAFLSCLFKLAWTWSKCREILAALDRLPLREAFSRMKRLSWHSLWNPGGSTLRETYKLMSRGIENLTRLKSQIQDWRAPLTDAARWTALTQIDKITMTREDAHHVFDRLLGDGKGTSKIPGNAGKPSGALTVSPSTTPAAFSAIKSVSAALKVRYRKNQEKRKDLLLLMENIQILQGEMAKMTAGLISNVLKPMWDEENAPVVSEDERIAKTPISPVRMLAEEYAALTYVNFLVTVLLRMRMFVICAAGMYVFIVLSTSVYPFEPHAALQTLAIVLLAAMGAAVGYVYAEMHREAILSRLTSKEAGELGWDFWLKLAAAGAIPVFSLLAVQFPAISQLLFSWLEPALQVAK